MSTLCSMRGGGIVSLRDEQAIQRGEATYPSSHSQDVVLWPPGETTAGLAPESTIAIIASSTLSLFFLRIFNYYSKQKGSIWGIQILFLFSYAAWRVVPERWSWSWPLSKGTAWTAWIPATHIVNTSLPSCPSEDSLWMPCDEDRWCAGGPPVPTR